MVRLGGVNLLGVALAALAMYILSFAWYGLAFDDQWLAANRFTDADYEDQSGAWMVAGILIPLVLAFGLGWLMKRADVGSPGGGAMFCSLIGAMIAVPIYGYTLVYSPWHSLGGFAIDGSHAVLSFMLGGAILAYFE